MNFIIRNLGWILLIIFFVFMLYLISNQNNTKDINTISDTTNVIEQSELVEEIVVERSEDDENISPLIETIKDEQIMKISQEIKEPNEETDSRLVGNNKLITKIDKEYDDDIVSNISDNESSTGGIVNSLREFFSIEKVENSTGTTLSESLGVDKDLIAEVENELNKSLETVNKDSNRIKNDKLIVKNKEGDNEGVLSLNNNEVLKKDDKKSLFNFKFGKNKLDEDVGNLDPSKELVTGYNGKNEEVVINKIVDSELKKIKKVKVEEKVIVNDNKNTKYKIAVKSMFLNNAWFTKRTGVLYKGDSVEQLTSTNQYGCFKIRVLSSSNVENNAKVAWACKYYMVGYEGSLSLYENAANNYYKDMNKKIYKKSLKKPLISVENKEPTSGYRTDTGLVSSKVGTIYGVAVSSLKLNDISFTQPQAYLLEGDKVEQITNINSSGCFKVSVYSSANVNSKGKIGWVCKKYLR